MGIGEATPSLSMPQISVDELHLLRGLLAFPNESSLELAIDLAEVWPWLQDARDSLEDAGLEAWREEYRRLFFGGDQPAVCPHHASAYPGVPRDAPWRVARLYARAGLPLCNVPPDYVGSELNLLAELLESEHDLGSGLVNEAWSHMAAWIPQFARCLGKSTRLDFYRGIAARLQDLFA